MYLRSNSKKQAKATKPVEEDNYELSLKDEYS